MLYRRPSFVESFRGVARALKAWRELTLFAKITAAITVIAWPAAYALGVAIFYGWLSF